MLVAGIAVLTLLAILFLALGVRELFGSDEPGRPGPFTPPAQTSGLAYPSMPEDCEDGRWRNYAQFESEEECREYLEGAQP